MIYIEKTPHLWCGKKRMAMIADTPEELRQALRVIGIHPSWVRCPGTPEEHYQVSKNQKRTVMRLGEVDILPNRIILKITREKRKNWEKEEREHALET